VAETDTPRKGSDPVLLSYASGINGSDNVTTANGVGRRLSATPPVNASSPSNQRTSSPALSETYPRNGASLATSVISYGSDIASNNTRGGSPLNSTSDNAISRLRNLLNNPPSLHTQQSPPQTLDARAKQSLPEKPIDGEIAKRESKILEMIHEQRKRLEQEAAEEATRQENEWQEQGIQARKNNKHIVVREYISEKKAKEAEKQIRLIAQRARATHQQSLRTSSTLLPFLEEKSSVPFKEAMYVVCGYLQDNLDQAILRKKLARPPKPKSRDAILQWFCKCERPVGSGLIPGSTRPAQWFHGIISRTDAERLLEKSEKGKTN